MTGNRVEKLESRVRELEATLNGLTDELVDTKDRLETVERETAVDDAPGRRTDIVEGELLGEGDDETEGGAATEAENDTATGAETEGKPKKETEAVDSDTDGIIVA